MEEPILIIRDPKIVSSIPSLAIRQFIRERIALMTNGEAYDRDSHGIFILTESGDRAESVQAATGCPLLTPMFEYVEAHDGFHEIVYVFNYGSFAYIVIVPDVPDVSGGIDPCLVKLCADFA